MFAVQYHPGNHPSNPQNQHSSMSLKRGDLSTLKATQVKTSVARGIRKQLAEDFPSLEPALDYIFGKKLSVSVASWCVLGILLPFMACSCLRVAAT